MNYSLGTWFGIPINLHWTFLVLLFAVSFFGIAGGSLEFTAAIFGSVLLHELGHAMMAKKFGIKTKEIQLTPLGGVAKMEAIPPESSKEIAISLAGPAVNYALALLMFGLSKNDFGYSANNFIESFFWSQVVLGTFNLLPVFPMDGGRVLRAILQLHYTRLKATQLSVKVANVCAIILVGLGIKYSMMLAVIAVYLWQAGKREIAYETQKAQLSSEGVFWDFEVEKS